MAHLITIPVAVLLHLRLPDRDIYRRIVLDGPQTTTSLRAALNNLAAGEIHNALDRLSRLGLVTSAHRPGPRVKNQPNKIWTAVAVPQSKVTVHPNGRVSQYAMRSDPAAGRAGAVKRWSARRTLGADVVYAHGRDAW